MQHKTYSTEISIGETHFRLTWDGETKYNIQAMYKERWVDIDTFYNNDYDNPKDALSFALQIANELKP